MIVIVEDSFEIVFNGVGHAIQVRVADRAGLLEPCFDEGLGFISRIMFPKQSEILFEQMGFVDCFIQSQQGLKSAVFFLVTGDFFKAGKEQIARSLDNGFSLAGILPVLITANFIDDVVHHCNQMVVIMNDYDPRRC